MTMNPASDAAAVLQAAAFAAHKHSSQRRKDAAASPYINHPLAVAALLASVGGVTDVDVLCAALLHDTVEDTATSLDELAKSFNPRIARIVREVSDDKSLPKAERKRLQVEHGPHLSLDAKYVKLADKICNVRDVLDDPPPWPVERKREYLAWATAVVAGLRGVSPPLEALFDRELARHDELA